MSVLERNGISEEKYKQIEFLKSLPREKQIEIIKEGKVDDFDLDNDGLSNYLEGVVGKGLFDPFEPNKRYVLFLDTVDDEKRKAFWPERMVPMFYSWVERNGIPKENVYVVAGRALSNNGEENWNEILKEKVEKIAEKSTDNDFVYLILLGHGEKGEMYSKPEPLKYETLDKWFDEIDAKVMTVIVTSCFSGSSIPYLEEKNRIVITSTSDDSFSITPFLDNLFEPRTEKPRGNVCELNGDVNEDKIITAKEFYEFKRGTPDVFEAKGTHIIIYGNPQISDPENIRGKIPLNILLVEE